MALTDLGSSPSAGPPRWIGASLEVKEGRDPLGLQTTTQDRLMPRLLPGILELSRRARYFSFHAYLLDKYRELRLPTDLTSLSTFIKAREWEYGLAVLNCPYACGTSPVGAQSLRSLINRQGPPYPRGESVESALGGYGLYYRSPLAEFGIVARSGTLLGDTPISVDVLYDTARARRLASTFREAIESTDYAAAWMLTSDAIPLDVLVEYARSCCLCQLCHRDAERDAVHDAMFGEDSATASTPILGTGDEDGDENDEPQTVAAAVVQRRRSVAHYLTLVDDNHEVVDNESAYREALWSPPEPKSEEHLRVAGQWAGLVAKDVWQDALCSVWSQFCRGGVDASLAEEGVGLTWDAVRQIAKGMVGGPPAIDGQQPTLDLVAGIAAGDVNLPELKSSIVDATLESLRQATDSLDTATSGLVVILELHRRAQGRDDPGWLLSSAVRSAWQASLATVLDALTAHLSDHPTTADTLWWLVHHFIVSVHEHIAYSKLPEHTFRFRWEDGRVRFFNNGIGRFPLAAVRYEPLAMLTRDLGLWSRGDDDTAALTYRGEAFIAETFG